MKNENYGNSQSCAIEKTVVNAVGNGAAAGKVPRSSIGWRREGRSLIPLTSVLSPIVPHGERKEPADFNVISGNRRGPLLHRLAPALGLALSFALAGCVSTPHTTIQGTLNGSPFVIKAPKDGDLTGFDLTADTNGVMRIHIDHLTVKMNPDVIGQTGAAQTAIIQATGEVASGITAAAVEAALKGK
jgi:hypothetical protein